MTIGYSDHQAREEKAKDKAEAKQKKDCYVATFDMQAVLNTPCALTGELYYARKLCCYNLSIYSLADGHSVCHVWDETQGKRGANEIGTCLIRNTSCVCASSSHIKCKGPNQAP